MAGTPDGARRNYNRKLEPTINEAIKSVCNDGGAVFAAHPGEIPNIFHRLFLRRDFWRFGDFNGITAFQAVNGNFDVTWQRARKLWIRLLLSGKRLPLIAGNDSHGDFNRYMAISIPFLLVAEDFGRHFAKARTGIYCENLIDAIKTGHTFITSGPFIRIKAMNLVIKSNKEFGKICKIWLYTGDCKTQKENCVYVNISDVKYFYSQEISQNIIGNCDYLRAETICENERGEQSFAATSPTYLERETGFEPATFTLGR